MNTVDWIVAVLLIVGGLNWGLVGLFNYDLVAALFGPMSAISRAVYILVGVSGVVYLVSLLTKASSAVERERRTTIDTGSARR